MDLSNFIILYVEDVQRSVDFYRPIFEIEPVESSASFALFVSKSGAKFGLWDKKEVLPKANNITSCNMEVALFVENRITLNINYIKWHELGIKIIQDPVEQDFGTTFTAEDPDGHRLRVFCYEKS